MLVSVDFEDNSFSKNSVHYSKESQLELLAKKQDLRIKKVRIQDIYLKLMVDFLFEKVFDYSAELSLDEFYLSQDERLKLEQEAILQSQRSKGDNSPNIIKEDFLWSKTIPFESGNISEPNVKLKDIGKFRAFLTDEKVSMLLSYNDDKKWNKLEIENELVTGSKSYESVRREQLFKEIQQLEKAILKKWPWDGVSHPTEFGVSDNKGNRHPNFKHCIVNGILRKSGRVDEADIQWLQDCDEDAFKELVKDELAKKSDSVQLGFLLVMIRNQFAHNHLPVKQFYQFIRENYPEIQGETVSSFYLEFVQFAIPKLLQF